MVSTSISASASQLADGLSDADKERLITALEFVTPYYTDLRVVTEQNALQFVLGVVSTLAMLRTDVDSRIAALLFELPELCPAVAPQIEARFGKEITDLVTGIRRLMKLREAALTQQDAGKARMPLNKPRPKWRPCARWCLRWQLTCAWFWCGSLLESRPYAISLNVSAKMVHRSSMQARRWICMRHWQIALGCGN